MILLTRPINASIQLKAELAKSSSVKCILSPLLRIKALPVKQPPKGRTLIFTSPHAVTANTEIFNNLNYNALCVGEKTAEVVKLNGVIVNFTTKNIETLVAYIAQNVTQPCHYMRGQIIQQDIKAHPTLLDFDITEEIVYKQIPQTLSNEAKQSLLDGKITIIPLFSSKTAEILMRELKKLSSEPFNNIQYICMSSIIANKLITINPNSIYIAKQPNQKEVMRIINGIL